jgi:glycosyltransferase involved in cell wall biosynthesis
MQNPLISVVISTYNQEKYIAQCLTPLVDELIDQSAEIIVADDCSNDNTIFIAREYESRFPSLIRVIQSLENKGANKNYLLAHSLAKGSYVAHIDGDDVPIRGKIFKQLLLMQEQPDVNLVLHAAEYFNDAGQTIFLTGIKYPHRNAWLFSRNDLARWGPISVHSSFMYRRIALKIDEITSPFMEWTVAMNVLSSGIGVFSNERLIRYRYNPNGGAWTSTPNGKKEAYHVQWNDTKKLFHKEPELQRHIYSQIIVNLLGIILAKSIIPKGMLQWLVNNVSCFRAHLVINSLLTRLSLKPRKQ